MTGSAGSSALPRPMSTTEVLLVAVIERLDALLEAVQKQGDEPAGTASETTLQPSARRTRKRTADVTVS